MVRARNGGAGPTDSYAVTSAMPRYAVVTHIPGLTSLLAERRVVGHHHGNASFGRLSIEGQHSENWRADRVG